MKIVFRMNQGYAQVYKIDFESKIYICSVEIPRNFKVLTQNDKKKWYGEIEPQYHIIIFAYTILKKTNVE